MLGACAAHEPGLDTDKIVQEVTTGSFGPRYDDTLRGGGMTAVGASLAGRADGATNASASLVVSAIPVGASVFRATLYWAVSGSATATGLMFNTTTVTGASIATGGDPGWGTSLVPVNTTTYLADVTALVTGNGTYSVSGLPSSILATSADTDGVALLVTYKDLTATGLRRIVIRDGVITTTSALDVVSDTFAGTQPPFASTAKLTIVVGDGQSADGVLTFEGTGVGAAEFGGATGSLWDVKTYPVSLAVSLDATWSATKTGNDGLAFTATGLEFLLAQCGDGRVTGDEGCDDGNATMGDGCSTQCTVEPGYMCSGSPSVCRPICGDGLVVGGEACDDHNTTGGDGCSAVCTVEPGFTCAGQASACTAICGDSLIVGPETCDDGNTTAGDGCSMTCRTEPGYTCAGTPSVCATLCGDGTKAGNEGCDDGNTTANDGCSPTCAVEPGYTCTGTMPSVCLATCGDGTKSASEACDDGNTNANDGCSPTCTVEQGYSCTGMPSVCTNGCGNGTVMGSEECDDGNNVTGDGCSGSCMIEPGYMCTGTPSVCSSRCGDGVIASNEACDDGNHLGGDGCSATCMIEPGSTCEGMPSRCAATCGDGLVATSEACDDGNTSDGDGCSATCQVEANYYCDNAHASSKCEKISVAGGGCNTGGDSGGGLALIAVGGMLALRRRRRGHASLLVAIVLAIPQLAAAQVSPGQTNYSVERFRIGVDRNGLLDVEAARTSGHLTVDVGLWMGYSNDPLTIRLGDGGERLASLVGNRYGGDLVASVGLGKQFELGFAAPLILAQTHDVGSLMGVASPSSFGLGNVSLFAKNALYTSHDLDLAIAVHVTVPTKTADDWFGDRSVTVAPELLLGGAIGRVRWGVNLGYLARAPERTISLIVDDELYGHAGLGIRAADTVELLASAGVATAAADPFSTYNANYVELRGGVGVDVTPTVRVFGAAGVGLAEGFGTPDWRGLAGVMTRAHEESSPRARLDTDGDGIFDDVDRCPTVPENKNGFEDEDGCPDDDDQDHDGIKTPVDKCPTVAETVNGYQDDDGCPDEVPDRDGDGIKDNVDKCPDEPEDKDGFQDEDGCPDLDNDGDGLVDAADHCPDVAGPIENIGCPDSDRDGDTVVDRLDNCPDEPGTVANHGCKDKQLVVIQNGRIELLDVVYFDTAKATIQRRSFLLLENVARVILVHPEITKITVEGHTDDRGDDGYNHDLSQRRAESVVSFIVGKGVSASKLMPIGYGESRPIADNKTDAGRSRNRRVEFKTETGPTAPVLAPTPPTPTPAP